MVLLFGNGSAVGLEVDKKIEPPGAPAQIWGIAGDFSAIKAWHPLVQTSLHVCIMSAIPLKVSIAKEQRA